MDDIIDFIFGDSDAETYKKDGMGAVFLRWEQMNKDKHDQHSHEQRKQFSPSVLSFDEMLGKEAQVVLATLSQLMVKKTKKVILHLKV